MKTFIVAALILGAAPAFAQSPLTTTQSPPGGSASESTASTTNSLPKASGTERPTNQPGATLGGVAPAAPTTAPVTGANATTTAPAPAPASK